MWDCQRYVNILLVHNYYQIGGGEHTVFENERRLLTEHGHRVITYTRDNRELQNSFLKKLLLPFEAVFSFKTWRDVKRIIKNKQIALVHCHNTFPLISPSVYYAAKQCGIPVIQTIHNFRLLCPCGLFFRSGHICEDCTEKNLFRSVMHGCYRNSRIQTAVVAMMLQIHRAAGTFRIPSYIFLTGFNRNKYQNKPWFPYHKSYVKGNFVYHNPEGAICGEKDREDLYIYAGRLDKAKGIMFLLDAWKEQKTRTLMIFGDGKYKNETLAACKRQPNIKYMGFQEQDVLFSYMKKARALLFPSELYEGFPMNLVESFALGTPVICSDTGNHADLVKATQGGTVYRLQNKDSFAEALQQTETDFSIFQEHALQAYRQLYEPEGNYRILKKIYDRVLSGYRAA